MQERCWGSLHEEQLVFARSKDSPFTEPWEKAELMVTDGCMWGLSINYFYFLQIVSQIILPESEYGEGGIANLRRKGI